MKLEDLIRNVEHGTVKGPLDRDVTGLAYDSRQVRPGSLFVALPGEHVDGTAFIEDAVKRGAVAIVSQRGETAPRDITHIEVADARRAGESARLTRFLFRHFRRREERR